MSDRMYGTDFPILSDTFPDNVVTEGHVRYCRNNGHATHTIDDVVQDRCPRCGENIGPTLRLAGLDGYGTTYGMDVPNNVPFDVALQRFADRIYGEPCTVERMQPFGWVVRDEDDPDGITVAIRIVE